MLSFIHDDLDYNSTHTYQVRARNANGYSQWSEEQSATSLLDPWRNVPESEVTKWNGGDSWGNLENAFDHSLGNLSLIHILNQKILPNLNIAGNGHIVKNLNKLD